MSEAIAGFIVLLFWGGLTLFVFRWWIPYEGLTQYVSDKRRWRRGEPPQYRDGSQRGPVKAWKSYRESDDDEESGVFF